MRPTSSPHPYVENKEPLEILNFAKVSYRVKHDNNTQQILSSK